MTTPTGPDEDAIKAEGLKYAPEANEILRHVNIPLDLLSYLIRLEIKVNKLQERVDELSNQPHKPAFTTMQELQAREREINREVRRKMEQDR